MQRTVPSAVERVLAENIAALSGLGRLLPSLAGTVTRARRVFVAGSGRSGLVARAFAMRLRHLGIDSYVVGETVCPPARRGDLFVAVSCSGATGCVLALVAAAKRRRCTVWAVVGRPTSALGRAADRVTVIPSGRSAQPGNARFEQAAFLFLEALLLFLRESRKMTAPEVRARHANLE